MLDKIKAFFEQNLAPVASGADQADATHRVQLASCALLLEMVRIDSDTSVVEQQTVVNAIRESFDLSDQEAQTLISLAEQELDQSTDYFQFTSLINQHFSPEQKIEVIEAMWQVAYSDQTIDAHERHLMRKISSLLHVPHGDHMAAKARGKARAAQ